MVVNTEFNQCAALGRTTLPEALAVTVEALKVGSAILHALGMLERAAWNDTVTQVEWRADALALAAWRYGDLSETDYHDLAGRIRERAAARCERLQTEQAERQSRGL